MIDDVSRQMHANVESFLFLYEKYRAGALPFFVEFAFPSRCDEERVRDSEAYTADSTVIMAVDNSSFSVYIFPRVEFHYEIAERCLKSLKGLQEYAKKAKIERKFIFYSYGSVRRQEISHSLSLFHLLSSRVS